MTRITRFAYHVVKYGNAFTSSIKNAGKKLFSGQSNPRQSGLHGRIISLQVAVNSFQSSIHPVLRQCFKGVNPLCWPMQARIRFVYLRSPWSIFNVPPSDSLQDFLLPGITYCLIPLSATLARSPGEFVISFGGI